MSDPFAELREAVITGSDKQVLLAWITVIEAWYNEVRLLRESAQRMVTLYELRNNCTLQLGDTSTAQSWKEPQYPQDHHPV